MIEIDFSPDRKTLRQFGGIALVGFGVLAGLAFFEKLIFSFGLGSWREPVAGALAGLGVIAAFFSLAWPPGNRPLFVGASLLAFPIGFVLSYVILGTLFFLVIAPTGLVMRALGRDPIARRYDPEAASYWTPHPGPRPRDSYFKQY